jgi:hypothetical protein
MYAIEVERVQLQRGVTRHELELDDYVAADPDPLHQDEGELLADLADHHGAQLTPFLRTTLARGGVACGEFPVAVRLDRHGLVVRTGPEARWVRLDFSRPVTDRHDLAHLLHPVLFPHCHGRCRQQPAHDQ